MRGYQTDPQWVVLRILSGGIAALVMAGLLIGILVFGPRPLEPLRPERPRDVSSPRGVHEVRDWFGLVRSQAGYENGWVQGLALDYYPMGSVHRVLLYHEGKLDGPVREFYEKPSVPKKPQAGWMPSEEEIRFLTGQLKWSGRYRDGLPEGHFEKYSFAGLLLEEGEYRRGRRSGVWRRYGSDGRLMNEKRYDETADREGILSK